MSGLGRGRWKRGRPCGHPRLPGRCAETRHHNDPIGNHPKGDRHRASALLHKRGTTGKRVFRMRFRGPGIIQLTGTHAVDLDAYSAPFLPPHQRPPSASKATDRDWDTLVGRSQRFAPLMLDDRLLTDHLRYNPDSRWCSSR